MRIEAAGELGSLLRALPLDRAAILRWTEPGDDMRAPLTATREATYSDDPAAALVRLLCCREEVAAGLLPVALREALRDAGLVDGPALLRCPYRVGTAAGLLLVSDYLDGARDAVMGGGQTTAVLYRAARPPRRLARVLDLGCGAGTLALLLAADADLAIGTDINPRAAAFARFNAALNAIGNAEFRAGDLYQPVAREHFELIVSQPPYYPAGADHQTFLHGGVLGTELCLEIIGGALDHLSPLGHALIGTCWPDGAGLPALARGCIRCIESGPGEVPGTRHSLLEIRVK